MHILCPGTWSSLNGRPCGSTSGQDEKVSESAVTYQQPRIFDLRDERSAIIVGNAAQILKTLPDARFRCCVTSPPYWGLRDYEIPDQIGAEEELTDYVRSLVAVFSEVRRTLADEGTLWLNIGDSFTSGNRKWRAPDRKNPARAMTYRPPTPDGLKPKDLVGVPWRLAFALQEDGWYLRSDIIWHKPNCQPESVKDRPTRSHEYVFLLSKSEKYYYNFEAVQEEIHGKRRNRRSVWSINTEPFSEAHFATFPRSLVEPCILAGSAPRDEVLDPFFGSGTVGEVCTHLDRAFTGIELNPEYADIAQRRLGWKV
ncbi:MAG: site-specific DNA-methyltransferase [Planctomycetaceae bacterium]|nr:site-specific DNA-methyltransferase [Planctomycetaceae bacterium]